MNMDLRYVSTGIAEMDGAKRQILKRQNGILGDVLENKIVKVLLNNPKVTQVEMATQLNVPYRTLQRKMDEMKLAERIGSKRFGYWRINE